MARRIQLIPANTYYQTRLLQHQTPEGEVWLAEHPALPGCCAVSAKADDAVRDLKIVRDEWLATAHRFGHYIPQPKFHLEFEVFMAPTASPCPAYRGNSDVETGIASLQTVWIQHEGE